MPHPSIRFITIGAWLAMLYIVWPLKDQSFAYKLICVLAVPTIALQVYEVMKFYSDRAIQRAWRRAGVKFRNR